MAAITKVESQQESFDLGATFENVFLSNEDNFSLKDLYDYLNEFFQQDMFVIYSDSTPTASNVKVWYDTTEERV